MKLEDISVISSVVHVQTALKLLESLPVNMQSLHIARQMLLQLEGDLMEMVCHIIKNSEEAEHHAV